MSIDPSEIVFFEYGFIKITATLLYTWLVSFLLIAMALFIRSRINRRSDPLEVNKIQNISEALIVLIRDQIKEMSQEDSDKYFPFIATIFIFILFSNFISIIPWITPPTASLNTSTALAICVFLAVPYFGIKNQGVKKYLQQYIKPNIIMLPFNIIGEISRTLALAIRLYGNVMSSGLIVLILLGILPLFFPIIIDAFGLLVGAIQAYVFAILSMVYILSATQDE